MNQTTDNQHIDNSIDSNQTKTKSNPWPLYIIIGMVAFVLISGYLLSPKSEQSKLAWVNLLGTTNNGILLNPPVEVQQDQLLDLQGQSWQPLADNTWKLLVVTDGVCGLECQNRLKELHAIRIRLHRDADRLTIGLVSTAVQELPAEIAEFHDLNLALISDQSLWQALKQTNMPTSDSVLLLMNPIDVFMMAYSNEHTGVEILADFEHLLDLAH